MPAEMNAGNFAITDVKEMATASIHMMSVKKLACVSIYSVKNILYYFLTTAITGYDEIQNWTEHFNICVNLLLFYCRDIV